MEGVTQISEYVYVNNQTNSVKFFGDENDWIKVDDLDAWIAAFYDACIDISNKVVGCSSQIERTAFIQTSYN